MDVGTLKVYGTLSVAGSGKVSLSNHTHPGKTGPQGFSLHRINESYTWINDNYVYGSAIRIPYFNIDKYGRITSAGTRKHFCVKGDGNSGGFNHYIKFYGSSSSSSSFKIGYGKLTCSATNNYHVDLTYDSNIAFDDSFTNGVAVGMISSSATTSGSNIGYSIGSLLTRTGVTLYVYGNSSSSDKISGIYYLYAGK